MSTQTKTPAQNVADKPLLLSTPAKAADAGRVHLGGWRKQA